MKNQPEIDSFTVQHLPIISAYARRIGVIDIINTLIPTEMAIDAGTIVHGMVLDTLTGRSPLYRLEEFFKYQDTELLLGKKTDPSLFSDYTVGRVLDRIHEYGTMMLFSQISMRALEIFNIDRRHLSFDTTSVSVEGDYDLYSGENGNDDVNNEVLSYISKYMAENGIKKDGFIYIADSAMVTRKNLLQIGDGIQFISRLPATYKECSFLISAAVSKGEWVELGKLSQTVESQKRPAAFYKAWESDVCINDKIYRAVVIHSSAHDRRRQKRIEKELKKEHEELLKAAKKLSSQEFYCRADAEQAAMKLESSNYVYYVPKVTTHEIPKYKRGRPQNDGSRLLDKMMYGVSVELSETGAAEKLRKETGCFVLITNVPIGGENGYSSYEILRAYKDQYGIEQNFGFLKNTPIVNSIFLKKASRIEVLACIFLLSLLVWRLIEYNMRRFVQEKEKDLPGWKKRRTDKPTTFMLMTRFQYTVIIKIDNSRRIAKTLTNIQHEYLAALTLSPEIFTNPIGWETPVGIK